MDEGAEPQSPVACADALARTAHETEKLSDLQMEYELLASALLALKQATGSYLALRPDIK